jgi:hypothetical protein
MQDWRANSDQQHLFSASRGSPTDTVLSIRRRLDDCTSRHFFINGSHTLDHNAGTPQRFLDPFAVAAYRGIQKNVLDPACPSCSESLVRAFTARSLV